MVSQDSMQQALAAALGDAGNLDRLLEDSAAGLLLAAVATLRDSGEDTASAMRYATYLVLTNVFGREFVRREFDIPDRTERRWAERVREVAAALGDEPSQAMLDLAVRGGFAALRNPSRD